ncbi:MAG TPA: class II D-tagatose-bisphosphate aldolase, non-catalytic subunit [Atribacteraceae bacterium]|nr:class II D-tagatose-bisphosphate aldolase, non-catalytic subunit [Atribacteraceae bacterium]
MMSRQAVDSSEFREMARERKIPLCDFLLRTIKELETPATLFAACPNSEAVIKASLRAAKRANAPIKFAATLNQVDLDGGYTGLNHFEFAETIKQEAETIDYQGPIIIAVDHGGPWLKDLQTIENWTLERSMAWIKQSFEAAVEAGYDLIHVDPTVERTLPPGSNIPIERVVERTIELIEHTERFRRSKQLPPIAYEVGTEEVHGGLADLTVFDRFLGGLQAGLTAKGLDDVWPVLVVGKVGTDLHTTFFDGPLAQILVNKARAYGSFIKGHYTDYVDNPEDYPRSGIGGANVGPEFTEEEYNALVQLSIIEEKLYRNHQVVRLSKILDVLENAVYESGRWKKWLQDEERSTGFCDLSPKRKAWLIKTGCRYIWSTPQVLAARNLLYANLTRNGYEPEEMVLMQIERSMDKYYRAFGLTDLNTRLKPLVHGMTDEGRKQP